MMLIFLSAWHLFQVLAILISDRRTAISWGFLGSSCNQLITHHRFNKLPTNKNPPTHSLLAVVKAGFVGFLQRKKTCKSKFNMIKRLCFHLFISKVPNLLTAKTSQRKNTGKSMLSTGISNRHEINIDLIVIKWVSIRSSIESGGML